MMMEAAHVLYAMALKGSHNAVANIIEMYPGVINSMGDSRGGTALHAAARNNHSIVVAILLAHPDININAGEFLPCGTAFSETCKTNSDRSAMMLLMDPRLRQNALLPSGESPLVRAISTTSIMVIRHWIASGRDMWLGNPGDALTDAIGKARTPLIHTTTNQNGTNTVLGLLESYRDHRKATTHMVRIRLGGYPQEDAADIYSLVIFLSDDLVKIRPPNFHKNATIRGAASFLHIAERLPLELQMVLCRRAAGKGGNFIVKKHSEPAFKALAMELNK
jgi:ankyrin repeat protein